MSAQPLAPRYDPSRSYEWNFENAPSPLSVAVPPFPGEQTFCGLPVASPLGIPAGPLLNGKWCLYYAGLGFDVLTYKTVRSSPRDCYPLPNLQPVDCGQLNGNETELPVGNTMHGTWAVSYGMPSMGPEFWQRDITATRDALPADKLLSVSVVGSMQPGWTIDDLARDYARCARWARDAGADTVEANLSCPNVTSCDGQLYQHPRDAALVAAQLRDAIADTPLILKIGYLPDTALAKQLIDAVAPYVQALAMTNSIATTVRTPAGKLLFEGQCRGICGDAIRQASVNQVATLHTLIQQQGHPLEIIGVGGVQNGTHVEHYLTAGAHAVHMATAPMMDPLVAIAIREHWSGAAHSDRHERPRNTDKR